MFFFLISMTFGSHSDDLNSKVSKLISKYGDINYGLVVTNLNTKKNIVNIHGKRMFVPASVTKLFSVYFALKEMGSDYKFKTSIYSQKNKFVNGKAKNLYLKFTGDPSLTNKELNDFLSAFFKKNNINKITGNFIIDDRIFDNNWTSHGGFTWDDLVFGSYASPKHTIIINENTSKAYQIPHKLGKKAFLKTDEPHILQVVNNVTVHRKVPEGCSYKSRYLGGNQYEVYGCLKQSNKKIRLNFSVPEVRKMLISRLQKILKKNHVDLRGKIIFGKAQGKVIDRHLSAPIKELIPIILQDSNNLYASSLFKVSATKKISKNISDEDAKDLMKRMLRNQGFNIKYIKINDGSGESRYNLVSPLEVNKLLGKIYNDSNISKHIIHNLPVHGKEGTLENRKFVKGFSKKIIAKTGTLGKSYISALAGYYKGKQTYSFALFMNNHNLPSYDAKALEDKILQVIFKNR